ncbi:hypothetical protein FB562_2055 [Homoserinimonas aerilata]|uniref:DNA helicase n=1 Tax=Homoserinimonas aerilata TaxID=1162970 RepID=A0A542YEM7_9MICO|nr:hypothetical protein [Homoserinimonas aerilata]TQL46533.1 hypothetical protein FB562_2055 [Homoserinimonas aerilata]
MALSRKRARELKRLKHSASDLWDDQREVLDHASRVVREAGRQVGYVGREEVAPRVRDTYEHRVRPVVATGVHAAQSAGDFTRDKIKHDVLPSLASAVASTLAVIEVAKDARVKDAVREIRRATDRTGHQLEVTGHKVKKATKKYGKKAEKYGQKVGILPPKKTGPGRYIVLGVGLVALAGLGYAVWQTLRADDELWITEPDAPAADPDGLL